MMPNFLYFGYSNLTLAILSPASQAMDCEISLKFLIKDLKMPEIKTVIAEALNAHAQKELHASNVYLSASFHFEKVCCDLSSNTFSLQEHSLVISLHFCWMNLLT